MGLAAPRKGRARLKGQRVGDARGIAKLRDPRVIHQKEIEDSTQKLGLARARHDIGGRGARGTEEDGKQVVMRGQPAKSLKSKRFRRVLSHRPPPFAPAPQGLCRACDAA